jgi:uncharacterized protein DUF6600
MFKVHQRASRSLGCYRPREACPRRQGGDPWIPALRQAQGRPFAGMTDQGWASALVLASVTTILLLAAPLMAQENEGNPPGRVARLGVLEGKVSLQVSGSDQWSEASRNYPLSTGDRVYTDQGGRAELQVGPFAVRMSEMTDLTVVNLTDQLMQLGMGQGTIRVGIYALNEGDSVEVDTPNGALTLLEPGNYRVDADANGNGTLVIVDRGSLQVTGGGADQRVERGQAAKLTGSDNVQVELVSVPSPDDFDRWSRERDRRLESARSREYVGRGAPGYDDLDEYGRWETHPDYGPVWYPTAVPEGWVPYRYGRWVWVEPWGWTWVEEEPWGFCPFHYGRWVVIGPRWCWIPGPVVVAPVYAPALVVFVGGPNFVIGVSNTTAWFPLGPSEPYYPWYHYGGNYLTQVNVTNTRNVTNITNITNITNVNTIQYVNRGRATTAVPGAVFSSGQPVLHHVVPIPPDKLSRAVVIPHPQISPSPEAARGGRPAVPAPPIAARPFRPAQGVGRAGPPETRPLAPTGRVPQTPPGEPASRQRVITRTPPPPERLPFPEREKAMSEDPGRPLEPQQRENVRQGKAAGPRRDQEVPPHPKREDKSKPSRKSKGKPEQGPRGE